MSGVYGKRITLKDIAHKTGYTINTVSRALKGKDDIAHETRELIRGVAHEMGYIGNAVASSMRSGKTFTVAIILGDISNPLFAIRVKELETELRANGYDAFVINTEEDSELEARAVVTALSRKVDGVIICPTQKGKQPLELMQRSGVPYVLMGRHFDDPHMDYVVWDDRKGGYLATKHLLDTGRRRILHLSGPSYISSARERLQGYRDALAEAAAATGMPGVPTATSEARAAWTDIAGTQAEGLVLEVGLTTGSCRDALCRLICGAASLHPAFDAIFAFSDLLAWEAVVCLQGAQLRIPDDVAIVGYDDIQSSLFVPFPLSTISASKRDEARLVVKALLDRLVSGPTPVGHNIVMKPMLVRRGSS